MLALHLLNVAGRLNAMRVASIMVSESVITRNKCASTGDSVRSYGSEWPGIA
jgi:hypothetical protein